MLHGSRFWGLSFRPWYMKGIWLPIASYTFWKTGAFSAYIHMEREREREWSYGLLSRSEHLRVKARVTNHYAMTTDKKQDCPGQTKTVTVVRGTTENHSVTQSKCQLFDVFLEISSLFINLLWPQFFMWYFDKLLREKCRYTYVLSKGFTWLLI